MYRQRRTFSTRVVVAGRSHLRHARGIAAAIRWEVAHGNVGMAVRPLELVREKIVSGDAVVACEGGRWVGFCYVSPWEGGEFLSTSALIVRRAFRGRGVARKLKEAALRLGRSRYPNGRFFGLTTSGAVCKINQDLGFRIVSYSKITRDPEFWRACESCPSHRTLRSHRGRSCRCRAMLLERRR